MPAAGAADVASDGACNSNGSPGWHAGSVSGPHRRRRRLALGGLLVLVLVAGVVALRESVWWPLTTSRIVRPGTVASDWPFPTGNAELVCQRSWGGDRSFSVVVGGRSYPLTWATNSPTAMDVFAGGEQHRGQLGLLLTLDDLLIDARTMC